ncbi:MAG: hypothetical protein RSE14_04330 [Erythrobacter sp.]|jgi:hypothetical protein|uniref:hypothetical protein n=1 Tax=Erythrobacter sp. TaxID=1042 RepID=UPI002B480CC1|nr:hypothetical protein [Erythrobacter sp.]WRH71331.1 MAG: hypothetical protein RSE14_04330 [Erythrobacter sp.]
MHRALTFSRRSGLPLLAGLGALALGFAAPVMGGTINSDLQIGAGKTFELGGGQEGAFAVTGRNTGPVAVEVLGRAEGSSAAQVRGTVAPGGEVNAKFASGEMALLRNTSAMRMARLKLKVSGDTSALGMTYSDNP